jgi:hypothetical protein
MYRGQAPNYSIRVAGRGVKSTLCSYPGIVLLNAQCLLSRSKRLLDTALLARMRNWTGIECGHNAVN